ncbi:hypothetical protein ACOMHN_058291 [Nucella lapillus]
MKLDVASAAVERLSEQLWRGCQSSCGEVVRAAVERLSEQLWRGCQSSCGEVVRAAVERLSEQLWRGCQSSCGEVVRAAVERLSEQLWRGCQSSCGEVVRAAVERLSEQLWRGCQSSCGEVVRAAVERLSEQLWRGCQSSCGEVVRAAVERLSEQLWRGCQSSCGEVVRAAVERLSEQLWRGCQSSCGEVVRAAVERLSEQLWRGCQSSCGEVVRAAVERLSEQLWRELFDLTNKCESVFVNVHDYDEIDVKSMERRTAPHSVSAGATCLAYFKTTNPDQGLCIRMQGVLISSEHVSLEMQTGPYGPERIFRVNSPWRGNWCFPHSFLVVKVHTDSFEDNVDRAVMYSFAVTNVSLDSIQKNYYMDSFLECGWSHKLTAGQKVTVEAERNPAVTSDLPSTCELIFESTSEEENEQLCLELKVSSHDDVRSQAQHDVIGVMPPGKALNIEGLNTRFYSSYEALRGQVACSENKRLNLTLTRNHSHFFNFLATLTSQWHPNWEVEENEAAEMRGLRIVKGITYFIATIDSLVAILGAGLAYILKKPTGPWRRWAEEFNAHAAAHAPQPYQPEDPGSYGSMHACKDGNYPELPLEGATPTNEVLVETHTY